MSLELNYIFFTMVRQKWKQKTAINIQLDYFHEESVTTWTFKSSFEVIVHFIFIVLWNCTSLYFRGNYCTFYSITFIWQLLRATLQILHVKVEIILIISKYEVLIWFRQPNRQVDASVNASVIIIQYNLKYWSTERFKLDEDAPNIK